jgi:hypothetical protein
MLLANLAKSDSIICLLKKKRDVPKPLSKSSLAIDQLLDCFVKGADGSYNKDADYDYLSYFFADMARHPQARSYFTTPQEQDESIVPISKIQVFTSHKSHIRRLGVASTIKNVCFYLQSHPAMLNMGSAPSHTHINILPYLLLPLMGPEDYSDEDMEGMPDELQLLEPDKEREPNMEIIKTHLESILLLATTREGREQLRNFKVYPIIRECHLHVENEEVREACDRIVQLIMRDEAPEEKVTEVEDDEDEQIIEVL